MRILFIARVGMQFSDFRDPQFSPKIRGFGQPLKRNPENGILEKWNPKKETMKNLITEKSNPEKTDSC